MELQYTLGELDQAAGWFWQNAGHSTVFAFHGEMGAGKTTLIRAICAARGVEDEMGSPTFSIINEYAGRSGEVIYHLDLYRLQSTAEAVQAGVEDCLYSGQLCLVEWPEKAPGLFPPATSNVYITLVDSQTRRLRIIRN